jgi:hypothetical protein
MRYLLLVAMLSLALLGCRQNYSAVIPEGCYRFSDGVPFVKVQGGRGIFQSKSELKVIELGAWVGAQKSAVQVRPAFVLHDGTLSPPHGPARMPLEVATLSSGKLGYAHRNNQDTLIIPLEAYGEIEVVRGEQC